MPAIKVSDYLFFLQTYYLGHQLLEKYYTRMQQILPELSAPTIERCGPGFSLGVLIDEALSMNQGTQRLLVARILEQQASPQSALIPVWDYYLVLNDQQNLHTFLTRIGLQMKKHLKSLEAFYRLHPGAMGACLLGSLKRLQAEASAMHPKMLETLKDRYVFLAKIAITENASAAGSFETFMQHLNQYKAWDPGQRTDGIVRTPKGDGPRPPLSKGGER